MKINSFESFGEVPLSKSLAPSTVTPELTTRQKITLVLVAVLSSFAVGSIPVIYAFTLAQNQNQTTTSTPIIRGEMF